MGNNKIHVPGCGACCQYTASDGSTYTDDFSSLASWTKSDAGISIGVSGGNFFMDVPSALAGSQFLAFRTISVGSTTDLLVIMEAEVQAWSNLVEVGILFASFVLTWRPNDSEIDFLVGTHFQSSETFNTGDKLTMKLKSSGSTTLDCCAFVNDEPVLRQSGTKPATGNINYGLFVNHTQGSGDGHSEWDNLTLHVGNP